MIDDRCAEAWTELVTRVLAPNPSPMTLEGTNSFLVAHPGSHTAVLVDPGPQDQVHLQRLLADRRIELILLTHRHVDHSEAAKRLSRSTGAPVRAKDELYCVGSDPLRDGETILAAGCQIDVIATPGHSSDSMCFYLPDDRSLEAANPGSMLTGDTILGRGTTVIAQPDGSLADYLHSLEALKWFGSINVLPGHGPMLHDLRHVCGRYLDHRRDRLGKIGAVLQRLGLDPQSSVSHLDQVTREVYPDIEPGVAKAAQMMVQANLTYLSERAQIALRGAQKGAVK